MKQKLLQEQYPIFSMEIAKTETHYESVTEIIGYFKQRIEQHEVASFIATYDHYAHTASLPQGQIDDSIHDAKCIIFCFGITLPEPQVLAVRPRSIGVLELPDSFYITFMEAPMPVANVAMESWTRDLSRPEQATA